MGWRGCAGWRSQGATTTLWTPGVGLHPQGTANGCPAAGGEESGGLMWAVMGLAIVAVLAPGCMLLIRRKEAAAGKEDGIYSGPV